MPDRESWGAVGALLLGVTSLILLGGQWWKVRGTTLTAPWGWAVLSLFALIGTPLLLSGLDARPDSWHQALRLAAASSTFCPFMSLLGAKRPQHRAWNFVVLTLWIVLLQPGIENLWLRPESRFELRGLRALFMLFLLLLGILNHLPTRFWPVALLVGLAQGMWLSDQIAWLRWLWPWNGSFWLAGHTLLLAALLAARWTAGRPRGAASGFDRLWLDFRDQYGLLWALRLAEQLNATARLSQWSIELRWNGLRWANGRVSSSAPAQEVPAGFQQAWHNLLRRFVSTDWIARRMSVAANREIMS
jgi:hypothetical protein